MLDDVSEFSSTIFYMCRIILFVIGAEAIILNLFMNQSFIGKLWDFIFATIAIIISCSIVKSWYKDAKERC